MPGWNENYVNQIKELAPGALDNEMPHIILLMIGTNDVVWADVNGDTPGNLGSLLDLLTSQAPDALIVVAKITPCNMGGNITAYNNAIPGVVEPRIADGKHLVLVDMYDGFPQGGLSSDGVHPNPTGYGFMADVWYEAIHDYLP